ncbi:oxygen-regulated protein 1-like [Alosa sapidissima]|uniref:oxygen-regulated protein 1-like n=1 Tax=Alosa sapidissima TaxID=34773 RepID=UPI001C09E87B|nr:oxygen-regulated protein 1-like [Alosa sapidissima]
MSDATSPSRKHGPLQPQSSGSGRTMMTAWRQQPYLHEPISSKHVCFYKSGDSQFSGLPVVINNRTFKTFESLLDSLSRRVPLPFGVRTITTPRGHTTVRSLDQLQNGHSYICSDQRTVKPVDLERARRRPPPWYHARPASGPRRRALQQPQRLEIRPRRRGRRGRESTPHLLSTPKRLVVFRNGEPEERHTLLLQRRSARSFEALLDYMSEVMRFPVVKLYMPDGRRVDGLPTLILCSGVLVAAGREPFKVGDYDTQRPTAPTWLPAKRVGTKWVHPSHRKKKSGSSSLKSRLFSPSSERFFVNQIHNSVAGSAGDYPSNAAGSVEMETGNPLGSLAGTDILTYGEAMGDTQTLPDDDIEKSFRVNQDGSMTVEMKVRLTIKEEETVHWTTTLSRSAASNQMGESSIISGDVNTGLRDNSHLLPDLDPDAAAMETSCYNQDLPPPMMDSAYSEQAGEKEEEEQGRNAQVLSSLAHRVPTPGPRKAWQMQASVENAQQGPEREGQEGVVGSYSYREEKQEYCMVRQTTNRPVPKPRNATLSETNKTMNSSTSMQSQYKSAEVLKLQNSGEEIRETVLHIYEQQTCQDNFVANTQVRVQGVSLYSPLHGRPATSETVFPASSERTFRSSSLDLESEQNLSSASKSNSRGKQNDDLLLSSNTPLCQTSVGTDKCSTAVLGKKIDSSDSNQQTAEYNGDTQILTKKRKPVKFVLKKNSHIFQSTASEKKRSEHVAEILKGIRRRKNNPGTSVGLVKGAERLRVKTAQKLLKKRQRMRAAEYNVPGSDKSSLQRSSAEDTTQVKEHQNELSKAVTEEKKAEKSQTLNVTQKRNVLEVEGLRGKVALIRQTSMHDEKRTTRETVELSESVSLPALNSSSSMINEYVEQWLLKSRDDAISELEEAPPCNTDLNSESASQTGDEPRALFHVSTDREASFEIGCEMIHMTEDPSGDALTASLPSLVQLSQISQDPFQAVEPTIPTTELMQTQQKDLNKSDGFQRTPPANPTMERNTMPTNSNLAKENEPSNESHIFLDPSPPKPLPRSNTLENKQSVNLEKPSLRYESQRKAITNQTSDKTPQPSQKVCEESLLYSSTSLKPSPMSPVVESIQMVTKSTERNIASSDSHRQTKQVIKSANFPPPPQDTERRPQTSNVVATQKSYTVRMAARPDMRPVVEQLCLSIHSIKETTQQKRPSCLEKSNSLPDFSSHIASTFGSSTRVLLAFLSVMTLKDGLANLNSNKQPGIDNLSYSEALRLLDSLKELARIEDAHVLSESLSALQNSISRHLLQSWRGFQELRDQVRSRSGTPSSSESEGPPDVEPEEEKVIQELMGELGVPERVREELAKLNSTGERSACEQASIKETLATIKGKASHFQNVKMKFTENIVGGTNQEKIPEEHKLTVESARESYPNQNTVTVQQSEEYFKEESYDQESTESYHKELDAEESHYEEMAESLPELTLNGFIDSHPVEDAASIADSGMGENVTQSSVALSNSNLMPNVSSGEQNSADEKGQPDSKCQFIYMDSQAEHLAQSKAESDIHPGRQLSDEEKSSQEEMLMEEQKNTDETENKGVEIPSAENEDVSPTEEETEAVEPQISVEEEKPSSSEGLEDEEDEDDICEELMGLSDEQVDERDKFSDTQTQHAPLVEYITNASQTSLAQGRHEKMGETESRSEALSQLREAPTFQIHQDNEEKLKKQENSAVKNDGDNTHSEGKAHPSHTERPSSPVEHHIILENPECYSIYQESYLAELQWATGGVVSHRTASFLYPEERTNVGGLISNFEEQPRHVEQKEKKTPKRSRNELSRSHIEVQEVSENDDFTSVSHLSDEQTKIEEFKTGTPEAKRSPSVTEIRQTILNNTSSQLINTSRSSPASRVTSPLAFSYDSRSRDSEGSPQANRVKSIREMFLAKSSSENQFVQRRHPGPLRTDRSESRPATSDSGATGSQHSPDVSSAEEDTGRMAIAKGYVRRTIERLYGGGGTGKAPEANRPPSASKGKRKEALLQNTVRSLAAVHEARSRVISDLSYFNATSSFDITEPTQCIAMNAQVGSKNAVLIDEGRWLMRENHPLQTTLLESPGTPANMKSSSSDYECGTTKGDRKEDAPYSHFSSAKSHSTDTEEPVVPHCTYLTLPHGGDSEPEEDEPCPKADPSKKKKEQKVAPITEAPKACSERNGVLPAFIPEFKKSNNKVHPLMDFLPLSPPVMTQPSKRQASQATQMGVAQRTAAEPDFLEMLYLACGEHCPFL